MQPKPNPSAEATELRRIAEARLKEQHPEAGPGRADADTQRLVHELQVHQIELEMQNEELQHARDAVEAEMEKYSDLYDFAPVGYLTLDPEGTIREANLTCASLLGIERSRLLQRRLALFVAAADQPGFNDFLQKIFESRARKSCEVTLSKRPPIAVRIEAAISASGQECRAAVTDITERKRADMDRLVLSKLESTGVLAGGIAHDYSNLLTTILLNLELAQTLVPAGEEFLARRLQTAERAALLAQDLTQQLVTFAQGDAPVRKGTSMAGVIHASVQSALNGSTVRCEYSLAEDLWPADVDAGQIGQVLRNLVLNAREAMPRGGDVSVRAENVVVRSEEPPSLAPGEYLRVSIADRGTGIAKEVLPRIFDPYFSTKQRGERRGLGLGLTISHAVIQKHGGAILVESEVGVGSTFHLYLPACRKSPAETSASVATIPPRPGRILVMQDEGEARKVVGASLERMGHEVELVADGQRAVEVYRRAKGLGCPFDLVLLDLTVRAGVGGQEAMQALRKIDPTVKAIVMSGHANDPVVMEPERHGFKGVLAKPVGSDSMRKLLAQVMGSGDRRHAAP